MRTPLPVYSVLMDGLLIALDCTFLAITNLIDKIVLDMISFQQFEDRCPLFSRFSSPNSSNYLFQEIILRPSIFLNIILNINSCFQSAI
jgi:hypothetical protein